MFCLHNSVFKHLTSMLVLASWHLIYLEALYRRREFEATSIPLAWSDMTPISKCYFANVEPWRPYLLSDHRHVTMVNFQFAKVEQCNYKLAHHNSLSGMIPLTQDPQ